MHRLLLLSLVALLGCPQTPWCDRLNPEQPSDLRTCIYATTASYDAPLSVDVEDGSPVAFSIAPPAFDGGLEVEAASADGRMVATGARDGTVRVWDAGTRQLLATWVHPSAIVKVDFVEDNRHLVVRMTGDLEAEEARRRQAEAGIPHVPDGLTRSDVIAIWRLPASR